MTEEQIQFIRSIAPAAFYSEARWKIPAKITMAQAILESGWGRSQLFLQANNPFGIKTRQRLGSEHYCVFDTQECSDGKWETIQAKFVHFDSIEDAFRQHGELFWTERYKRVIAACQQTPQDIRAIAEQIQLCGYSTDPHYSEKILKLIQEISGAPLLEQIPQPIAGEKI